MRVGFRKIYLSKKLGKEAGNLGGFLFARVEISLGSKTKSSFFFCRKLSLNLFLAFFVWTNVNSELCLF